MEGHCRDHVLVSSCSVPASWPRSLPQCQAALCPRRCCQTGSGVLFFCAVSESSRLSFLFITVVIHPHITDAVFRWLWFLSTGPSLGCGITRRGHCMENIHAANNHIPKFTITHFDFRLLQITPRGFCREDAAYWSKIQTQRLKASGRENFSKKKSRCGTETGADKEPVT